jgi:hypothetical protein
MTIKELKTKLKGLPNEMTVCVFANGEVYDIFETQLWTDNPETIENHHPTEFELGCGWEPRQ